MLISTNNISLFTKNYLVPNAKAHILIVHGLGEHAERYIHVANALNTLRANVYTFDLRGHGRSGGEQAFVTNINSYVEDVETVVQTIPKDLPLIVIGHSAGGLIALKFLLQTQRTIKASIFSGAALEAGEDFTPTTQKIVAFLGKYFPKLKTVKLIIENLSKDQKVIENVKNDPLMYKEGIKAGLGLALMVAIEEVKKQFSIFNLPVLIMHGKEDRLSNIKGSLAFYNQCDSKDKTLQIWEGAYHEIFNETNKEEVLNFMLDWLKERL